MTADARAQYELRRAREHLAGARRAGADHWMAAALGRGVAALDAERDLGV